jgi:hypothetical protein
VEVAIDKQSVFFESSTPLEKGQPIALKKINF